MRVSVPFSGFKIAGHIFGLSLVYFSNLDDKMQLRMKGLTLLNATFIIGAYEQLTIEWSFINKSLPPSFYYNLEAIISAYFFRLNLSIVFDVLM